MSGIIRFKSKFNTPYFYSHHKNLFMLCHPVLDFLVSQFQEGADLAEYVASQAGKEVEIPGYGAVPGEELAYYYQKFLLLKGHGYFEKIDLKKAVSGIITAEQVKKSLANSRQLTFEVTDACNLSCAYCAYGKLYAHHDVRENRNVDPRMAKNALDYLVKFWESPLNRSHQTTITVGFYGGEPLINFNFIRDMVEYCQSLTLSHHRFKFNMTTNALLLAKHIDFLAKHKFQILVSLDGDEAANGHRVLNNGQPAFERIMENVEFVRRHYPDFFETNVFFNSVLHSKNSIDGIHKYIKETFGKVPTISELNKHGVAPEQEQEFWRTYKNYFESLREVEDYSMLEEEMFTQLPETRDTLETIFSLSGNVYEDVKSLTAGNSYGAGIPSATCLPFSKKVYVTVNGKILACERIGHRFELGFADENKVDIDFSAIAQRYNRYYDKIRKWCQNCHNSRNCKQCLFYLNIEDERVHCKGFMNEGNFATFLAARISYLESNPQTFVTTMSQVKIL